MFGLYHDDSIYFASAKAIAEGNGNVLTTLPGPPAPSKYPIVYPWLLSWVWRAEPDFPANLPLALAVNLALGVAAVLAVFGLLRQLGAGETLALGLTGFFAWHPQTAMLSRLLLSDVVYTTFALWSLVLAHRSLQDRRAASPTMALALALGAAAAGARSIGLVLLGALASYAAWRRKWLPAAAGTAVLAVFVVAALRRTEAGLEHTSAGFQQTWLFYTSYLDFWQLCVPDWQTLRAQVLFNLTELFKEPAVAVFSLPARGFPTPVLAAVTIAVSAGIAHGAWLRYRQGGLHPIHLLLPACVPLVLAWNYTLMDRFLFIFLPLFALGAWTGLSQIATGLTLVFREKKPWIDRLVSAGVGALAAALVLYGGWRYAVELPRGDQRLAERRERLLPAKQQAWEWVRRETPRSARLLAYEDVLLGLATGREAIRPLAFSTAPFYRQSQALLDADLLRLGDVARAVKAEYWVRVADDYELDAATVEQIRAAIDRRLAGRPVVFESNDSSVQIYDIRTLVSE